MHPALQPFVFPRTGLRVKNRCVLAAMTNKQSEETGELSSEEINWLKARSLGGFGIVTTAAAHVQEDGKGWSGEMGVWSDNHMEGLTALATSITNNEAVGLVQLFHGGMRAPASLTGKRPVSASVNTIAEDRGESRAMTEQEVRVTIKAFADAAARCEQAGFQGVELHGAHGYLIAQFLGKLTNRRDDDWGGDGRRRQRFLEAIVQAVRDRTSPNFLVGVRLSPELRSGGIELADALQTLDACLALDLDFIHVSCWDYTATCEHEGTEQPYTTWFSQRIDGKVPLISTGGVWDSDDALHVVKQGADFVGVARAGIAHPNWPTYLGDGMNAPKRPPFSASELMEASLSPVFIEYMRRWDGFVVK